MEMERPIFYKLLADYLARDIELREVDWKRCKQYKITPLMDKSQYKRVLKKLTKAEEAMLWLSKHFAHDLANGLGGGMVEITPRKIAPFGELLYVKFKDSPDHQLKD